MSPPLQVEPQSVNYELIGSLLTAGGALALALLRIGRSLIKKMGEMWDADRKDSLRERADERVERARVQTETLTRMEALGAQCHTRHEASERRYSESLERVCTAFDGAVHQIVGRLDGMANTQGRVAETLSRIEGARSAESEKP